MDIEEPCVIVSVDKDLLQIPGFHYNFVKKEKSCVTKEQGIKHFYTQLLTGDTSDNIQGCPGIGVAKAARFLAGLSTEESLFQQVVGVYKTQYKTKCKVEDESFVMDQILMNGRCLKIRTEVDEVWNFPKSFQTEVTESLSTQPTPVASNPSTELGLQTSQTGG